MAVVWIKKLLGVGRDTTGSQSLVPSQAQSGESESELDFEQLRAERYLSLKMAFCEQLFGLGSSIVEEPSELQRLVETDLHKKLINDQLGAELLPRRPNSIPMLLRLMKLGDLRNEEIIELLISDPSLTSQVLKVANSPFFRVNEATVDTLEEAIFRLGLDGIQRVVAAAIMMPVFRSNAASSEITDFLWNWALNSGKTLECLAKIRERKEPATYLLGLIPPLASLIILKAIDANQQDVAPARKLLPMQKMNLIEAMMWKTSLALREEWGLPAAFDAKLEGLNLGSKRDSDRMLCDALMVAQFAALDAAAQGDMTESKLAHMTDSSASENRRMLDCLEH